MWRWLWYTVAAVCIALWGATLVLWMSSYVPGCRTYSSVHLRLVEDTDLLWSSCNGALLCRYHSGDLSNRTLGTSSWQFVADKTVDWELYAVGCPHWFLVLVFTAATLCALRLAKHQQALQRRHRGLCEKCGYDLRASPERCPECGAPRVGPQRVSTSGATPDATRCGLL